MPQKTGGIPTRMFDILDAYHIMANKPMTRATVGQTVGMTLTGVSKWIKEMLDGEYLVVAGHQDTKRGHKTPIIGITRAGILLYEQAIREIDQANESRNANRDQVP